LAELQPHLGETESLLGVLDLAGDFIDVADEQFA